MALTQSEVSELYVSIFNRASEGAGNKLWQDQNLSMADTATQMLDTQVAKDYFGTSLDTNQAFIEHIYLNTLNKTLSDDSVGIANWVAELDTGRMTKGQVVAAMIDAINTYAPGGKNYDPSDAKTVAAYQQFENRVTVSDHMADTIETIPHTKAAIDATTFSNGLIVTDDPRTVTHADQIIDNMLTANGQPLALTTHVDTITEDGHILDDHTADEKAVVGTDDRGTKLSDQDDVINAPVVGTSNTLNASDSIEDSSNTDADTLEASLVSNLGSAGNLGNSEFGPTIRNIEDITLRGDLGVTAYSLKNVTTTADDANIVVNIDHNASTAGGKFISTTDITVNGATVVSNVDGKEIKEVNLIDHTRDMNFAEIANDAVINLTNGEIDSIGIDSIDSARLASENVTINMLNDKDGKLILGLYDDNDNLANAIHAQTLAAATDSTEDNAIAAAAVADATAAHDGGGFKEVTLVSSDVNMNVTLATGTHLNNNDSVHTDQDGFGHHENGGVLPRDTDLGFTLTPVSSVAAATHFPLSEHLTATNPADNPRTEDNLADTLNLKGSKDITISGTAAQLNQAVVKTEMTDDAKTHLAISGIHHTNTVNLTNAEVDIVDIDASTLGQNDMSRTDHELDATQATPALAQISIDDNTVARITNIGDWGTLGITGDADRTDDIELIINTGKDNSNNATLVLGGDDLSMSEATTVSAGADGDSTEAGAGNAAGSTQGGDADNALMHVEDDSTLNSLNIRSLLGRLTLDGTGDLRIENGGLIFDDSTVGFDETNNFAANSAASTNAEGEGIIINGFGGDWVDATAMTGDLRIDLRDNTPKASTATDVNGDAVDALAHAAAAAAADAVTTAAANPTAANIAAAAAAVDAASVAASHATAAESGSMDNDLNGIRIDFGSGDDMVVGLGSGSSATSNALAGDNIDMGAGDDNVVIGVNDISTGYSPDDSTALKVAFNNAIDATDVDTDTMVSATDLAADNTYITGITTENSMVNDRINAEVYLGEGQDTVVFANQNSGFLAGNNGVRVKDFQAGNHGDEMGFDMFYNVSQRDLDLFNNGEAISDTDTGLHGKYVVNGQDVANDTLNIGGAEAVDNGDNNGNVALISTSDIHKFNANSADALWEEDNDNAAVFADVAGNKNSYETILLVGETTGTDGVKIFYVTDGAKDTINDAPTASLVGFLEGINISELHADNFDFM